MIKVVPVGPQLRSGLDSTLIEPRCIFIMPYTTARPSPVPLPICLVVKNGSKIFLWFSSAMLELLLYMVSLNLVFLLERLILILLLLGIVV